MTASMLVSSSARGTELNSVPGSLAPTMSPCTTRASSLGAQPIRAAGTWGQLPAGAAVQKLEPLFPRIESE